MEIHDGLAMCRGDAKRPAPCPPSLGGSYLVRKKTTAEYETKGEQRGKADEYWVYSVQDESYLLESTLQVGGKHGYLEGP
jgi:hypothetical protein